MDMLWNHEVLFIHSLFVDGLRKKSYYQQRSRSAFTVMSEKFFGVNSVNERKARWPKNHAIKTSGRLCLFS